MSGKTSGKRSKLDVLAREMRSTEKLSAGYVGRDLSNTHGKQEEGTVLETPGNQ